jgi:hypothetical protein
MASVWFHRILTTVVAAGVAAAVAAAPGLADAPGPAHASLASVAASTTPPRPRLPANFRGTGRWIVADLGMNVPFSWQSRNGNSQMIAGGPRYRIWFTNLIYDNTLYTVTYKWPKLRLDPDRTCDKVGSFSLRDFNNLLRTARFVGPEILQGTPDRYVDHWRVGIVLGQTRPGPAIRAPFALGDVYVDQTDPSEWWQGLQFGFQNLYDPQLDEWFTMTTFSQRPGTVTLPRTCSRASQLGNRTT